jgi:hypothetical protein
MPIFQHHSNNLPHTNNMTQQSSDILADRTFAAHLARKDAVTQHVHEGESDLEILRNELEQVEIAAQEDRIADTAILRVRESVTIPPVRLVGTGADILPYHSDTDDASSLASVASVY